MKRHCIQIPGLLASAVLWCHFATAQAPTPSTGPATNRENSNQSQPVLQHRSTDRADQPSPRRDANSQLAHEQLVEKAKKGGIDIYFEGDSITRRWGTSDAQYRENLANWRTNFFGWNAGNFGWGADRIENILWRLENGELDGIKPKVIVLLAGTNNVGNRPPAEGEEIKAAEITRGLEAMLKLMRAKAPDATIILMAIFPRNDNMAVMPLIDRVNENLARLADGRKTRFLSIN